MIGLISATAAGAAARDRLAAARPGRTRVYEGPVRESVERAFAECEQLVCFLATGAVVRLIAPLLADKSADPGVVCVDEGLRYAVSLLGGHGGGANELAAEVADVLGCAPVVTTATDATDVPGLDTLGLPVEGAVAAVSRAILDGEPVALRSDAVWPLPPLPPNVGAEGEAVLRVTDRVVELAAREAVLRPASLVVGVGASKGAPVDEVLGLIEEALREAGLSPLSIAELATVDAKAAEPGIVAAAERLGVPVVTYAAGELSAIAVPNPSGAPLAAVGTPSVAEAAALAGGGELLVPKRKSSPGGRAAMATCAVVRRAPRGRLAVVGLGPGARDLVTPRATEELRRASVLVGLDQYVDQIRDLLRPGTRVLESGLGAEEERARTAVAEARAGHAVALIGSGDAGVYAMASPALAEASDDIDVVGVPGVTAALAAAAILGAPLGHDHVSISLSDLHTPWEVIERRVRAAAEADIIVTFYNPRSRGRDWQLPKALAILAGHREASTPVGVVRNASRADESSRLTTLAGLDPATVDMMTVVTVGNTATREIAGRMVTPRGYRWQS
ncbi:precorrin-3B C(17)-methyltransferase [Streptomyces lunaelactis]|uniref:precorrin-3B C(17)-methyltransferase n=1 Tax=Streptomyces lunaelactis TaxID=1535768 RepID=UPI00158492A4|nr:precorrin-3B C(17)-methyltransferase [Streptomyces lunaelactis]NUK01921.1 precorrin-3B C(17)-methyltransferase [Streptomyces lunaelactis]NUK11468.1 precorrin-3B C(17)-methyltransferase [Streptomyces lunaelactis]NUK15911.1 precorrin-3B C(17)-methyltransferase [Streptomyces lunaelactis]NUK23317.1 precorrin-3B C(17)-methyltransferase [Streptomyces lunaelactis]NUK36311.1 precorrin-3B C(17)-methyltransferase [Streptomyces lunaelactis]